MTQATRNTAPIRNAVRAAVAAVVLATSALTASAMPFGNASPAAGGHVEEALTVMQQRFQSADSDHDGRISREQARERMPFVYRNFDAIDTNHSGYVTLAQIEAFAARQAMNKRGAH